MGCGRDGGARVGHVGGVVRAGTRARRAGRGDRRSAAARDVVSTGGADVLERLREAAPAAAAAFESYLDRHGRRTLSYDPGDARSPSAPSC